MSEYTKELIENKKNQLGRSKKITINHEVQRLKWRCFKFVKDLSLYLSKLQSNVIYDHKKNDQICGNYFMRIIKEFALISGVKSADQRVQAFPNALVAVTHLRSRSTY